LTPTPCVVRVVLLACVVHVCVCGGTCRVRRVRRRRRSRPLRCRQA
jgi:hypothetical protein